VNKEKNKKAIDILTSKGATQPCTRCGNIKFSVLDGYFRYDVQLELDGSINFGGPHIPCLAVACDNCGNISMHALGALGLLPEGKKLNE